MKKTSTFNAKAEKYDYPSYYGSHSSMIDKDLTACLVDDKKYVALKDEFGSYVTERANLDTGLADPYRFTDPGKVDCKVVEGAATLLDSSEECWRKKEIAKRLVG